MRAFKTHSDGGLDSLWVQMLYNCHQIDIVAKDIIILKGFMVLLVTATISLKFLGTYMIETMLFIVDQRM